jgi:hypothetical protein
MRARSISSRLTFQPSSTEGLAESFVPLVLTGQGQKLEMLTPNLADALGVGALWVIWTAKEDASGTLDWAEGKSA